MDLLELTPRLHLMRFFVGQAYLWRDGDDLTLIDTGPPGSAPAIASAVRGLGTLRRVGLTHAHDDHTGSAAEIGSWPGATVLAHRADAPVVRGDRPAPPPDFTEFERELHTQVAHGLTAAPPARVDVELDDGDELDIGGGARVIPVPGHTDGSIALHLERERVLFTGDVIAEHSGELMLGPFNVDRDRAAASMRRLTGLDVDVACFGHGDAIVTAAGDALRSLG
ncbi:MBL fold metallo-hydrolase [Pseudonocardia nigra]|uniref:MBL fold metallo-hydrolase n=1 Tax=Pseudonocardia nigra TaxID=1921578 RepID=UPI0027E3B05B|nr:MBL fold metallo-hydrolase [Pseudonocardia nigra]